MWMSLFTKKGEAAVTSATTEGGSVESPIVSFKSGTTYKVRVKAVTDLAEYYGYGIFKKVNTFVPNPPAQRNERGYVVSDATVWDKASDLLYQDAKKAKESGAGEEAVKKIEQEAYNLRGKKRYLRAFGCLETGKDIVIDLSPKQEGVIYAAIKKYEKKLDKVAFEISKSGSGTNALVTFTPVLDMEEDLTEVERNNFDKVAEKLFDHELFETCLFAANSEEQIKNLVISGFDIGRLGLSHGGSVANDNEEVTPIGDEDDPSKQF
jgi:hypothetical protein